MSKRADCEPWPFGALAGKFPSIKTEDIKAARREALLGGDQPSLVGNKRATAPTDSQRSPTNSPPPKPLGQRPWIGDFDKPWIGSRGYSQGNMRLGRSTLKKLVWLTGTPADRGSS
jgi:hypothetical protein